MAGYTTDQATLDKAASNMLNTQDQLNSALTKMASELEPLRTAWKGDASTAFQNLIERFQGDAQKMNQALEQIANTMSQNASKYAAQEQEQQQAMSQITNMLQG
jgi:WXG100 family type VII secretion target